MGQQGIYEVTSYSDLEDIDLAKLSKAAEFRGGDINTSRKCIKTNKEMNEYTYTS